MTKKRAIAVIVAIVFLIVANVYLFNYQPPMEEEVTLEVEMKADQSMEVQIYYITSNQGGNKEFQAGLMRSAAYEETGNYAMLNFSLPYDTEYIRLDFGEQASTVWVKQAYFMYDSKKIEGTDIVLDDSQNENQIKSVVKTEENWVVQTESGDPYLAFKVNTGNIIDVISTDVKNSQTAKNIIMMLLVDALAVFVFVKRKTYFGLASDVLSNRTLVFNLSKNDFKTRFAGSFFGIFWAFVQPVVTVVLYWFVFQKALNVGTQSTKAGISVPYVLWLIAGLVPWFYFSEAWGLGTNALVEYSYLVKKVVFKISALPVVKIVSSLFVHLFFVAFTVILYSCYHYYPNWYTIQLLYYTGCMIVFTLGLTYLTSALVVFFRDLSQIIGILMQVLMWMTPIMWNIDAMKLNPVLMTILKMNPMFYIVMGYRDSLINNVWFWERPTLTIYFWGVTVAVFGIGVSIFKKLQVHFADVL